MAWPILKGVRLVIGDQVGGGGDPKEGKGKTVVERLDGPLIVKGTD